MSFRTEPKKHFTQIADGAMGTELIRQGFTGCLEALVQTHPFVIQNLHQQYLEANAEVILTHTFGANRLTLNQKGLQNAVADINLKAVQLAKAAVQKLGSLAQVYGCIGPTQLSQSDLSSLDFEILRVVFREQATLLVEAGVTGLVLETFYNAKELCMALEAALDLNVPLVSSITLTKDGKLLDDTTLLELTAIWQHYCPTFVGINCSETPKVMWPIFETLAHQMQNQNNHQVQFWIKLNAGQPTESLTPKEFASECEPFLKHPQVQFVGGCCGTSPAHIFELSQSQSSSLSPEM